MVINFKHYYYYYYCLKQGIWKDHSGEMTVNKTTILGQANAQKFAWLPSIDVPFKTINAR